LECGSLTKADVSAKSGYFSSALVGAKYLGNREVAKALKAKLEEGK
jgi:hypothetical protein